MLEYISLVIIMNKTLMNKLTHILEMAEKKKVDCVESRIILDETLSAIKDYLFTKGYTPENIEKLVHIDRRLIA